MSKIFYIVRAAAFIFIASTPVLAWASGGYIYDADGSVSIATGKDVPHPAVANDAVNSGTVVRTGNSSHAVLKFEDGQVVSLQANSTLLVREYIYNPQQVKKSNIVFSMLKGGMRFITGQIGHLNPKAFRLATPDATISVQGTEFLVVIVNNVTYSQVISGSIRMTNAAGTTVLTAGHNARISSSDVLVKRVPAASLPADTFSQITVIPVPAATPVSVPLPASNALKDSVTAAPSETAAGVPPVVAPVVVAPVAVSASDKAAGFYVGAQLGSVNYRYSNITNNGQIGFGLLGGYAINENFAVEAEYNSLGGFDSVKSTLKGSSIGVSGVGYYALNPQFALFGKLGVVSTSMKETAKPGFIGNFTHNNTGATVGIGGQYNINPAVGMRVGININPVGDTASSKSTAGMLYFGGVFKF